MKVWEFSKETKSKTVNVGVGFVLMIHGGLLCSPSPVNYEIFAFFFLSFFLLVCVVEMIMLCSLNLNGESIIYVQAFLVLDLFVDPFRVE